MTMNPNVFLKTTANIALCPSFKRVLTRIFLSSAATMALASVSEKSALLLKSARRDISSVLTVLV